VRDAAVWPIGGSVAEADRADGTVTDLSSAVPTVRSIVSISVARLRVHPPTLTQNPALPVALSRVPMRRLGCSDQSPSLLLPSAHCAEQEWRCAGGGSRVPPLARRGAWQPCLAEMQPDSWYKWVYDGTQFAAAQIDDRDDVNTTHGELAEIALGRPGLSGVAHAGCCWPTVVSSMRPSTRR
jgi:hypothetical protein